MPTEILQDEYEYAGFLFQIRKQDDVILAIPLSGQHHAAYKNATPEPH